MTEYSRCLQRLLDGLNETGQEFPWPVELLTRHNKQPHLMASATQFVTALRRGHHMDQIVVLLDGVKRLQQHDALPAAFHAAFRNSHTAMDTLATMEPELLASLKGNAYVQHRPTDDSDDDKDERDTSTDSSGSPSRSRASSPSSPTSPSRPSADVRSCVDDCIRPDNGKRDLKSTLNELNTLSKEEKSRVYVSEIRRLHRQKSRHGTTRKSSLLSTMRERLGESEMMYWDDYSEGLFIGGHNTAYSLHVDQLQTSNIGTQFYGHKLLAIWAYPDATHKVLDSHFRSVFAPPLSRSQLKALEAAVCIALVPPGAVWFFSGANAHAVCNIGLDYANTQDNHTTSNPDSESTTPIRSVCVNSYEAFVGNHPVHLKAMLATNTAPLHWDGCWMHDDDYDDFKEDVTSMFDKRLADLHTQTFVPGARSSLCEALRMTLDSSLLTDEEEVERSKKRRVQLESLSKLIER